MKMPVKVKYIAIPFQVKFFATLIPCLKFHSCFAYFNFSCILVMLLIDIVIEIYFL